MGQEYTVKTFEFPGMVARVHCPVLTEDERNRRIKKIHTAAATLLKEIERKKHEKNT